MAIHTNDDRIYSEIIKGWVVKYRKLQYIAPGIKIMFDGYGEHYDGSVNENCEMFSVFVHKNSYTEKIFPEHNTTPWGTVINRPDEEVCIYVWYYHDKDEYIVVPFEDNNGTNLDAKYLFDVINSIDICYYTLEN